MSIIKFLARSFYVFCIFTCLSACTTTADKVDSLSLSTDLSKRMLYSDTGPAKISFDQCNSVFIPETLDSRTEKKSCAVLPFGDSLIRFGEHCLDEYCDTYYVFNENDVLGGNLSTVRKVGTTRGELTRDDLALSPVSYCYSHRPRPRHRSFQEIISNNDGSSWLDGYGWNYIVDLDGMRCAPLILARSLTAEGKTSNGW